ncbi:MAG: hypothetical protein ABIJ56_19060 [Pseudomonadota bacterium]
MVDIAAIVLTATEMGKGPLNPRELGNPSFFVAFFLIPLMVLCGAAFLVYIFLVFVKATRIRFMDTGIRFSAPGLLYFPVIVLYDDIEAVEQRNGPVIVDNLRDGHGVMYNLQVLKLDLADLRRHIMIRKRSGFFREVRFCPRDLDGFVKELEERMAAV